MHSPMSTLILLESGLLTQTREANFLGRPVLKKRVTKGRFRRYDFCLLILSCATCMRHDSVHDRSCRVN